jgi:hypothetical protein
MATRNSWKIQHSFYFDRRVDVPRSRTCRLTNRGTSSLHLRIRASLVSGGTTPVIQLARSFISRFSSTQCTSPSYTLKRIPGSSGRSGSVSPSSGVVHVVASSVAPTTTTRVGTSSTRARPFAAPSARVWSTCLSAVPCPQKIGIWRAIGVAICPCFTIIIKRARQYIDYRADRGSPFSHAHLSRLPPQRDVRAEHERSREPPRACHAEQTR